LRSGQHRPATGFGGPKPAVPGLYLGGAGNHPGGGVSGIAGRIAADRVLRHLKFRRWAGRRSRQVRSMQSEIWESETASNAVGQGYD